MAQGLQLYGALQGLENFLAERRARALAEQERRAAAQQQEFENQLKLRGAGFQERKLEEQLGATAAEREATRAFQAEQGRLTRESREEQARLGRELTGEMGRLRTESAAQQSEADRALRLQLGQMAQGANAGSKAIQDQLRLMQIQGMQEKQQGVKEARTKAREAEIDWAANMSDRIKGLLAPESGLTPAAKSVIGAVGGRIPTAIMSPGQTTTQAALNNIISNLGLETIRAMKSQSATGATGFGQLNREELDILLNAGSTLRAQAQDPAAYEKELRRVLTVVDKIRQDDTPGVTPSPSSARDLINKYRKR